jgi:hypothetical protein
MNWGRGLGKGPARTQKNRSMHKRTVPQNAIISRLEQFQTQKNRSMHKRTVPNTKEPFKTHNNYNKTLRNCCSKHKITITKHPGTVAQNNNKSGGGSFPMRDGRTSSIPMESKSFVKSSTVALLWTVGKIWVNTWRHALKLEGLHMSSRARMM